MFMITFEVKTLVLTKRNACILHIAFFDISCVWMYSGFSRDRLDAGSHILCGKKQLLLPPK